MSLIEEVKLTYRNKLKASDRPKITGAQDAYKVFLQSWDFDQIDLLEECKAMFLDRQLRVMSLASISKGGFNGTVVDLRIVFAMALKRRANSLILAHNHPSGNLKPSHRDISLTRNFVAAGKIMKIEVEDHLVITRDGFHSIIYDL
ncbi:MAG: JAB domain-containing protein [Cytophagales bacterium]|nr:JAB domain-containing protein [Cytophagales bacterium]